MFVTMSLIPFLMRSAERWQIIDMPDHRKVHSSAIPRIGGLAMVAGALIPIVMWLTPNTSVIALLSGMLVVFGFGLWDDRKDLDYRIKFLGQALAVLIVIYFGGIRIDIVPFAGLDPVSAYISIPLTIVFLLGITNAINLSDGLDGLAGGTTLLSFGVIAVLGYHERDAVVLLTSIAVLGSILGFLRFNTYPARIFMGDGGSQFLGFVIGVLAVMLTQREYSALSPALPILLLGLPILDTLLVMGQRIYEKRSPFSPDKNHIHHKLLALGFDHYEAVFAIYVFQSILVISAYMLRYQSDMMIMGVYLSFCLSIISFFRIAHVMQWKLRDKTNKEVRPLITAGIKHFRTLQKEGKVTDKCFNIASLTIPVYLLIVGTSANKISSDIGILSIIMLIALAIAPFMGGHKMFVGLVRASAYLLCTLAVYIFHMSIEPTKYFDYVIIMFFVALALSVAVGFHFSKDKDFRVTTLDFLVIFVAFLIPNLPGVEFGDTIGSAIAQLIVLFYSVELIISNIKDRVEMLRIAEMFFFAIFGANTLFR